MRKILWLTLPVCLLLVCFAFTEQNPYFIITHKDVELQLPAYFPKPVYTFKNNAPKPVIFLLGRKLFYETRLSKDNTVSCGTCHQRIAAFAHIDHALSHGIYAKIGTRNVPALQNLIWKDNYLADGRVKDLEKQPLNPITNPIEMDETMESVVNKLRGDFEYRKLFFAAFSDSLATGERILRSLTQFTGLMISYDSRYDRFIKKLDTLSTIETRGLQLFRQKCGGCHREPLFTDNSFRSNGLSVDTSLNDRGRGAITKRKNDDYKFKVPGLRNIEMTYPYMHDGRLRTLQSVIAFYAKPSNFAAGADPLLKKIGVLTEQEQKDLLVFLKTLTDKTFLYDRRFVDPAMEQTHSVK